MRASEGLTNGPASVWATTEGASANDRTTRYIQFLFMATPFTEDLCRTEPHIYELCPSWFATGALSQSGTRADRWLCCMANLFGERVFCQLAIGLMPVCGSGANFLYDLWFMYA